MIAPLRGSFPLGPDAPLLVAGQGLSRPLVLPMFLPVAAPVLEPVSVLVRAIHRRASCAE